MVALFSHFDIACGETPIVPARFSCVIPLSLRRSAILSPMVFIFYRSFFVSFVSRSTAFLLYMIFRKKYRYDLASQLNCFDRKSTKGNASIIVFICPRNQKSSPFRDFCTHAFHSTRSAHRPHHAGQPCRHRGCLFRCGIHR